MTAQMNQADIAARFSKNGMVRYRSEVEKGLIV